MANDDVNITTREVASIAHVDPATVRRWAETGELRSFTTLGGHYRFNRAYIEQRFSASPSPAVPSVGDGALSSSTGGAA